MPNSKPHNPKPNSSIVFHCNSNAFLCKNSPSATLDLLIFILVLFSGTFLVASYVSYILNSIALLSSHCGRAAASSFSFSSAAAFGFILLFLLSLFLFLDALRCPRSRKCDRAGCRGLTRELEFDLQLQSEECLRSGSGAVAEIDRLPWKDGSESSPEHECLRAALKKIAPSNGRAVLVFRASCGCPVNKIEGWGPKKPRRYYC